MTTFGRYTGILRDDFADVMDGRSNDFPGVDFSVGLYAANMPRRAAGGDLAALATGVMTAVPVFLHKGDVVTNLTFVSGGTAGATLTHWWFALYSDAATPKLLAQTADQVAAAWAANTVKTLPLAAPVTIAEDGFYWLAVMVAATTVPTLAGATVRVGVAAPVRTGDVPLAETSGTALAATAPATIATPTTVGTVPFALAT